MRKRILCAVLSLLMLVTMLPITVGADSSPTITFEQQTTAAGASEVKVDVKITNNPGFVSATIPVKWDASIMTLTGVVISTEVIDTGWVGMSMDDYATNGTQGTYYLAWNNDTRTEAEGGNFTGDGKLCTMVFAVKDTSKDTSTDITANLTADIANMMNWSMADLRDSGLTATTAKVNMKAADAGTDPDPEPSDEPTITVVSARTKANKQVEIQIKMENNPGIASMTLSVEFNTTYLTLKDVKDGDGTTSVIPGQVHSDKRTSPYTLSWENDKAEENIMGDGVIATLVFDVDQNAPLGELPITITYKKNNIYNVNVEKIAFTIVNGCVNVINYVSGDLNDDGEVDSLDRLYLIRHLADWKGYEEIDKDAADLNEDGEVDSLDRLILIRHLADWEGYEVIPMPVN